MRRLKYVLACLLFVASVGMVSAQTKTIKGTVLSAEDGEPVIGASVRVKNTSKGSLTDENGKFSVYTKEGEVLVFSFLGMETTELKASNGMVVRLETSSQKLDQVLVVGYGTQRREAKTGSITQVNAEELSDVPTSSVDKLLTGKMAGVSVTGQNGQPGSSTSIRIRGTSSINAGNEPLYVVDGVPVMSGDQGYFTNTNNAIAMINPSDIETVTVLKDAAAASIYGSRAANGVILITTKSGKSGKTKLTARAKYGVSSLANDNNFGVMNPRELVTYMRDAVVNAGFNPNNPNAGDGKYYVPLELLGRPQQNWIDAVTRLGKMQNYELTAQGGKGTTTYYGSFGYQKADGIFYGVDFNKLQVRTNVDHEINKYIKLGTRINAGYMEGNDVPMQNLFYSNPLFAGQLITPWTPVKNSDGTYNTNIPSNNNTNPLAIAEFDQQWGKQYKFNGNMFLQVKPISELTLKTTNSADIMFGEGRRYWAPEAHSGQVNDDGSVYGVLQTSQVSEQLFTTSNTMAYDKLFDVHSLRVLVGQEANLRRGWSYYQYSPKVDPQIPYSTTGASDKDQIEYDVATRTLLSFLSAVDYNYDGKYYAQVSFRRDGSSVFGADRRWGNFYSVGLSWNMHNERFIKENVDWINLLKLRASYGVNGNDAIGIYKQYGLYSSKQYNGLVGMAPENPANPKLAWEKNSSYNFGLDFTLDDRYSGSFDVYSRTTSDMLLNRPLSATSGFTSMRQNIGSVRNNGFEFQFDVKIFDENDLKWNLGVNLSHNRSKILDLGGEEKLAYSGTSRLQHVVGRQLYSFYLYDYVGVNPVNGLALWRTEDGKITTDYSKANRIYKGSPEPDFFGGLNTSVSYKGVSLDVLAEYKFGNEVFILENKYIHSDGHNWNGNLSKSATNYWKKPGDTGVDPKPIADNPTNSNSSVSTRWLEKGDYVRIKDITLAYTFPSKLTKKAKLNNVRLYTSAYNLFTFHDVDFWDPERGANGLGAGIYPMSKTFVLGLDITF